LTGEHSHIALYGERYAMKSKLFIIIFFGN